MRPCQLLLASLLAAWVCLSASWARAETPLAPCRPDAPERVAAERELAQIDGAVSALDIAADPAPLGARIQKLTESPCFVLMADAMDSPTSALALKTYWDGGGSEHVHHSLSLGDPGDRTLWLAPSMRRALTLETNPQSPIRDLLCPFADAACGASTRGWAIRAEHEFETLAKPQTSQDADCEKNALQAAPEARFAKFRECQVEQQIPRAALPIGTTRALDHGWLIVQGRRGHYRFCDEVRAYDLATGSAYRVASCSGLALQAGGSVNFRVTDANRQSIVELGHLPLAAVRETAWMLLLLDEIDRNYVEGFGVSLPDEIPLVNDESSSGRGFGFNVHWSSGDTTLGWQVVGANAKPLKAGSLSWSTSPLDDAPAEHAATLLRVAEAELTLDCPSVPPPAAVLRSGGSFSANGLDADEASSSEASKEVQLRWREARDRQRSCAAAASGNQQGGRPRSSSAPP